MKLFRGMLTMPYHAIFIAPTHRTTNWTKRNESRGYFIRVHVCDLWEAAMTMIIKYVCALVYILRTSIFYSYPHLLAASKMPDVLCARLRRGCVKRDVIRKLNSLKINRMNWATPYRVIHSLWRKKKCSGSPQFDCFWIQFGCWKCFSKPISQTNFLLLCSNTPCYFSIIFYARISLADISEYYFFFFSWFHRRRRREIKT